MKNSKNNRNLEAQTFFGWKCRYYTSLHQRGVLSGIRPGNTCIFFSIFQKIESLYCFATKRFGGEIITSTFKRFNWKYTFYLLCFYIYFILLLAFLITEIIQERGPLQFLITNAKLIIIINKTEWQLGEEG